MDAKSLKKGLEAYYCHENCHRQPMEYVDILSKRHIKKWT